MRNYGFVLLATTLAVGCTEREAEKMASTVTAPNTSKSVAPPALVTRPAPQPGDQPKKLLEQGSSAAASTTSAQSPKPQAKIVFKEKEWDFATVIEGDECTHAFEFINEGPGELVLNDIQLSSACMTTKITALETEGEKDYALGMSIRAGMSGRIEAILNTNNIHGTKTGRITVISNDAQTPSAVLQVSVLVEPFFRLDPPHIYQGNLVGKAGGESVVGITCLKADSFDIKGWDPLPDGIEIQISKPDPEERNYAEAKVVFKPGMKEGVLNHQIVLKAEVPGAKPRDIRLAITGTILGPIQFNPPYARFGFVQRGAAQSTRISVQNTDLQHSLKVTGIEVDSPQKEFLTAVVKEDMVGEDFTVELTVNERAPPGVFKGTIIIKTNYPEEPEHKIAFSGVVR